MAAIDGPVGSKATRFDVTRQPSEEQLATVQPAENTLADIAKRLGQNLKALLQANQHIADPNNLKAGQDIRLPHTPATLEARTVPDPEVAAPVTLARPRLDDPLAKTMAKLQWQQDGQGKVGPGTVLAWKHDEGPRGPSVTTKARGAQGALSVGTRLGVNGKGEKVDIKREVGSPKGYDTKWQAMAVARLGGAEPAAVVLIGNKWHAVETTASIDAKFTAADATQVIHGMPSSVDIAAAQKQVKSLQARLEQLKSMEQTPAVRQESDQVLKDLTAANLRRASLVLGVPESDIKFQTSPSSREPGVINIVPDRGPNAPAGSHGPVAGQGGEYEFKPGMLAAFDIKYATLDDAAWAQLTLFHEVEHENHWEMAQEWVRKYEKETGRPFIREGLQYFKKWIEDQAAKVKPPRLSKADADLIVDVAGNFDGMTEARANIRQALLAYQLGAPDLGAKALTVYAYALTPKAHGGGQKYSTPHPKSEFMLGLNEEIRAAYAQMPKDMQRKFDEALSEIKKKYPDAWISQFKVSK
jgi:LysM repeat protein